MIRGFSDDERLASEWEAIINGKLDTAKDIAKGITKHTTIDNTSDIASDTTKHTSKPTASNIPSNTTPKLFTIGFIGQPNVGKSSLINTLFSSKVVSASRTPGHTKHFQTLHLSPHVRVCDSPGLIFPSFMDRQVQVLMGLYNVAQVRDPYGPLLYLAQRLPLAKLLKLTEAGEDYSIYSLCEAFALKCGFVTSKAGRPDAYRAGNWILRMLGEGRIVMAWHPPGYTGDIDGDDDGEEEEEDDDDYDDDGEDDSDTAIDSTSDSDVQSLTLEFQGGSFSILATDDDSA